MDDGAARLMSMRIAVIGAGWAGCAAAATLAQAGVAVTVYEAAAVPGGRARRVMRGELPLDNGQHLLLGAYTETLRLIALVHDNHAVPQLLARFPLAIEPLGVGRERLVLRARRLRAPFGLAAGVLTARGLAIGERWRLIGWWRRLARARFQCDPAASVADLVRSCPARAARGLWEPLCVAALNTPPARASAQIFANVLRAAFTGATSGSDFLVPTIDLSALFPEAAARFIELRGGKVRLRTRASVEAVAETGITVRAGAQVERFDAAVVAVGPHQLDQAIAPLAPFANARAVVRGLDYEPIATAWLGYAAPVPLPARIARLDDEPGQWVFDRNDVLQRRPNLAASPTRQLVAVVISASGPHEQLDQQALVRACDAQLRRLSPGWPQLAWSQVIVEQRASYACVPGRPVPASILPHPRVAIAGDWTDAQFPATLEAAVRSGVAAAKALEPTNLAFQGASQAQNSLPSFAR